MKIIFCGDIALSNISEKKIARIMQSQECESIRKIFSRADLVFGNIECPLTDQRKPALKNQYTHRGEKISGKILKHLGINIASLANNHIEDFGEIGLKDTIEVLNNHEIKWLGAGLSEEESKKPLEMEVKNNRVGIIALTQKEYRAAGTNSCKVAYLDLEQTINTVKELKRRNDIVVLYLHFGIEFSKYPTPRQINFCHKLIENGATLIIGHHPHVAQGIEFYKNGFIAYSLGNFIFDMYKNTESINSLGFFVEIEVNKTMIENLKIYTIETKNIFPNLLNGKENYRAIMHIKKISNPIKNENELKKLYYFVCRENFYLSLSSIIKYGVIAQNLNRTKRIIENQFLSHIFKLRLDLIKYILNGKAYEYENEKKINKAPLLKVYKIFCWIAYVFNFNWCIKLKS